MRPISKVKGRWKHLYRAVDSNGNTLEFLLRAKRDAKAAKRSLRKVLKASHTVEPRVMTVDKTPSYSAAIANLKDEEDWAKTTELR